MSFKQTLKTTLLPKIKKEDLYDLDNSRNSTTPSVTKEATLYPDASQKIGSTTPFVKIGGQIVSKIESLSIDETGFIPKLFMTFVDPSGEFGGDTYPKRNLLANVYIKSPNPNLTAIRVDFLITSMKSISSKKSPDKIQLTANTVYMVTGELFVPRLHNNVSRSYSNANSKAALQAVCEELGLGFFENDYELADTMTWINYATSSMNFIQHVADHAYQSDESFFTCFINKEYQLGLIEVNTQLAPGESEETFNSWNDALAADVNQDRKGSSFNEAVSNDTVTNFLTNFPQYKSRTNYIHEANLISDQGNVLKSAGYKKQIYYYDHFEPDETKKFKTFWATPLTTSSTDEEVYLVPQQEGMTEVGHKKWMNINYGNTHENWNAARIFNTHNLAELEKIQLRVLLKGVNYQAIRGMSIPVVVTVKMAEKLRKEANLENPPINQENLPLTQDTVDKQLSGKYYVKGAKYHFDPTDPMLFYTELFLARREWTPSKTITPPNA